ncbi:MAG: DUF2344 domain-containing protein [Acidobacteria bacterium]|nr:DUF2344 domain-containing protein [Acidobacteriota bacterium]
MTDPSLERHLHAARIRAEALARALAHAGTAVPPRLPAPLAALMAGRGDLAELEAGDLTEEALEWARSSRGDAAWKARLEPLASAAKAKRAARVHLDASRVTARARYAKDGGAIGFGPVELQQLFSEAMRLEGLPLELDLGKRPRPLLSCAPPLPFEAAGDAEWLEVQLKRSAEGDDLLDRINRRLPGGLKLLSWEELPAWATPVAELCETAQWSWPCDEPEAEARIGVFLASESYFLDKPGKVEGQKQEKRVDLRPAVLDMALDAGALRFRTALAVNPALSPLKLLGAILDRAPESIQGLRRLGFSMLEDPRLKQADRYTAKLKNMYEDAVLLGAGSNITLVDEDDDEPLSLG